MARVVPDWNQEPMDAKTQALGVPSLFFPVCISRKVGWKYSSCVLIQHSQGLLTAPMVAQLTVPQCLPLSKCYVKRRGKASLLMSLIPHLRGNSPLKRQISGDFKDKQSIILLRSELILLIQKLTFLALFSLWREEMFWISLLPCLEITIVIFLLLIFKC